MSLYRRGVLMFCVGLGLASCSDFAAAVRQVTYPPDFVYVTGDELRSNMDQLAFQLSELDAELAQEEFSQPDQREVVSILREIERISSGLQAGEAGASHPFLANDMQIFVGSVQRARMAASLDTPQYYLAGRVSGACMNCHRINR